MTRELAGGLIVIWSLVFILSIASGSRTLRSRTLTMWRPAQRRTSRLLIASALLLLFGVSFSTAAAVFHAVADAVFTLIP